MESLGKYIKRGTAKGRMARTAVAGAGLYLLLLVGNNRYNMMKASDTINDYIENREKYESMGLGYDHFEKKAEKYISRACNLNPFD